MIILYSLSLINIILNTLYLKRYLHIYQLKDYNTKRYFKFFLLYKLWWKLLNLLFVLLVFFIKTIYIKTILIFVSMLFNLCFNANLIKGNKTPLKYTGKIKRIYFISTFLLVFTLFLKKILIFSNILMIFLPIISNYINFYDRIKNKKFIKSAQFKLKNYKVKIIAITGSNGKTSVKNILHKMLETKYKVLSSPKSYNTPLGLSLFINQSNLTNIDFIILEFGARRINDIKNLCKTFGADYGIVTCVAPQHLESFKTLENVYLAKNQLPQYLNEKLCIFNLDNDYCKIMFNEKAGKKIGISIKSNRSIYASEIRVENFKTHFTLHCNHQSFNVETKLLGNHNITNILLCFALAKELNISPNSLINTINDLQPTPHRLEYIKGRINILDDSYNCSISSAGEAIKVLEQTAFKKMILTPGIIEGGKQQFELNFKLGKLCKNLDFLIIVGQTNKKAILDGLKSQTNSVKIYFAKSLEDSKQYFSLLTNNDTLLILNDLPDDYN